MDNEALKSLIHYSYEAKPTEFQRQIADILGQRVNDALDRRRNEIAQNILASKDDSEQIDNTNDEVTDEINNDNADELANIEDPNGQDT